MPKTFCFMFENIDWDSCVAWGDAEELEGEVLDDDAW